MNEIFLIGADYLKGKSIYNPLIRALDPLFSISIASFIFERTHGEYVWYDYNDYKEILDFFIKGNFFVPLSIFIAVYGVTQVFSASIFALVNHFAILNWTRDIIHFQVTRESIEKRLEELDQTSKIVSPVRLSRELVVNLYHHLRSKLTAEVYEKMEKELKLPKSNLEATYHLIFRAILAITLYFISLDHFGWILYCLTLVTLFVGMYLVMLAYRFLDILPTIVRKLHSEAEKYIAEFQSDSKK